jgi:hypothetical protein
MSLFLIFASNNRKKRERNEIVRSFVADVLSIRVFINLNSPEEYFITVLIHILISVFTNIMRSCQQILIAALLMQVSIDLELFESI